MKKDVRVTGGGKRVPISRTRKHAVGILISCLGLVIVIGYLISEFLEEGSLTGLLQHYTQPSLIFYHSMVLLSLPTFMLVGYFYQKQQSLAENLEQMVEERTSRLRESQARLKNVFAASPDAITVSDLNGNMVECNQATLDMHGCSSKEELIGKSAFELIAKKEHQRAMENMRKTLEQGSVKNMEYTFLAKDGREFPAELSASVIKDPSGNPTGFVAITKDITERKKAEEKLRFLKEFNERVVGSIGDALLVIDPYDYTIITANEAALKQLRLRKEDLIGKTCYETTHHRSTPCKPPHCICPIEEMLKTGKAVTVEHTHFDKDNNEIYVEVSASPVRDQEGNIVQIVHLSRDVTERKKVEEALRESEERFRNIFESANDCMIYLDRSGRILDVNKKAVQVFGGSRKEVLGKHFTRVGIFSPRDIPTLMRNFARILAGKEATLNIRIKNKKGQEIHLECSSSLMKTGDKVAGVMVIARDITERKKAEEKIRESEEKYRNLIDNSNDIVITADESGNWTFLSPSVKRILGYEPEEMVGRSAFDFMFPGDIASTREAHESVVREGRHFWEYENRWMSKDGRVVTLAWNVVALRDEQGNIIGTQGVGRDITERKKMEDALRESEELYRVLSESSLTGIAINMDRRYVYANPQMEEILGYSKGGLVGVKVLDTVHPDDRETAKERMGRRLRGEPIQTIYEQRRLRRDGDVIWVEGRFVPITYQNRPAILVNLVDITERKRMEEELRRYSEHLEEMVEEKTMKLRETERLATIGEMAGMVGHDLRNPLQVIVNAVYLAKKKLNSMPSPRAEKRGLEELFGTIKRQMAYMNKIVSDLQDYARPVKPELVKTSLHQLINDTLSAITVPETVKVSVVIEEDFPKLMVDPALMRRVFTNLVTNTLQAMPNGGQLTIRSSKTKETACISVEDTGVGISEENLDKLFQPLFTTKAKGTGLGLPVCKRLVEVHGGSIAVESKVGRGSTFTVKIPLRRIPLRREVS